MTQPSSKKIGELDEFPPMNFLENDSFPMDIDSNKFMSISLPPLTWLHLDKMPSKVNIRNSGYLLNVEPEYSEQVPSLSGSVLRCPYAFWCFHFHWGSDNENGSEHRIDGKRLPMEIHLLFYNVRYSNTDEALKAKDGILVLVYMCKLTDQENLTVETLLSNILKINEPNESTCVDAFPMSSLLDSDLTDYILYWRAYGTDIEKQTPWIISQKPVWVNESQLSRVRSLRGVRGANITSNCQCQRRYRRSEDVFVVTADHTRADREPERPTGAAADGRVRLDGCVVRQTVGATLSGATATDSCDLEGGGRRARRTPRRDDDRPGADELRVPSVKRMCADRSIDLFLMGHNGDDVSVSKTETDELRKVQKNHREGVRMNDITIQRENHIKNKLRKNAARKK